MTASSETKTETQSPTVQRPGCYVVRLVPSLAAAGVTADCLFLPSSTLNRIAVITAGRGSLSSVVRDLRTLIAKDDLPGLALVYDRKLTQPFVVPPPIRVPFQPVELRDGDNDLEGLLDVCRHESPSGTDRPATMGFSARLVSRLTLSQRVIRSTVWLFFCLFVIRLYQRMTFGASEASLLVDLVVCLGLLCFLSLQSLNAGRWFLVPGGVVVRQAVFGRVWHRLTRCTPADTLLIFRPISFGWRAELWHERRRIVRALTDYESYALLAAWQSPLTPPSADQLADLR